MCTDNLLIQKQFSTCPSWPYLLQQHKKDIYIIYLAYLTKNVCRFVWFGKNRFIKLFDAIISEEISCSPSLPRFIYHISQFRFSLEMLLCKQEKRDIGDSH